MPPRQSPVEQLSASVLEIIEVCTILTNRLETQTEMLFTHQEQIAVQHNKVDLLVKQIKRLDKRLATGQTEGEAKK